MDGFIYCHYCGAKNSKNNRFCYRCGHKLVIDTNSNNNDSNNNLNDLNKNLNYELDQMLHNGLNNVNHKLNNSTTNNNKHNDFKHQLNKPSNRFSLHSTYNYGSQKSTNIITHQRINKIASLILTKLRSLKRWWGNLSYKHKWYVALTAIVVWLCFFGIIGHFEPSTSNTSTSNSSNQQTSSQNITNNINTVSNKYNKYISNDPLIFCKVTPKSNYIEIELGMKHISQSDTDNAWDNMDDNGNNPNVPIHFMDYGGFEVARGNADSSTITWLN